MRFDNVRRAVLGRLALAIVAMLVASSLLAPPASAVLSDYIRTSRAFATTDGAGVELRTRGYIDDDCLRTDTECYTQHSDKLRPEATAQAKVIRELSFLVHSDLVPQPTSLAAGDRVQWEVGPSGSWRVDVVMEYPNPQATFGMMEVRAWAGPATILAVNGVFATRATQTATLNLVASQTPSSTPPAGPSPTSSAGSSTACGLTRRATPATSTSPEPTTRPSRRASAARVTTRRRSRSASTTSRSGSRPSTWSGPTSGSPRGGPMTTAGPPTR